MHLNFTVEIIWIWNKIYSTFTYYY